MRTVVRLGNPLEGSACVRGDLAVVQRPPLEVDETRGAWGRTCHATHRAVRRPTATNREAASPTSVIATTMTST
jgi:hypothetical protein